MSNIYPKAVCIRVTYGHIFRGWCKSGAFCAFAKAIIEEFDLKDYEVSVCKNDILIRDSYFNVTVRYAHTKKSLHFMEQYDKDKKKVKPASFTLKKISEVTGDENKVTGSSKLV